jgi:hypothetical protein
MRYGDAENYEPYVAVAAEGMRLALMTCRRCGAVVMAAGRGANGVDRHDDWHAEWTAPTGEQPATPPGAPDPHDRITETAEGLSEPRQEDVA